MKLVSKAFATYGLLLTMAGAGAGAAVWTSNQARYDIDRMELANLSYQAHLRLSNDTYQLFKEFGDTMVLGDADGRAREIRLIANLRNDIVEIRRIIAAEIQLVGSEEVEELAMLDKVEHKLDALINTYEMGLRTNNSKPDRAGLRILATQLDQQIDGEFNKLIQLALSEELEEVEETKAETRQLMANYIIVSILIGLLSIVAGIVAMVLIVRDIKYPIQALERGAREMALGNWNHRVPTDFTSELNAVSTALNDASKRAGVRQRNAEAEKQQLEERVTERTAELQVALNQLNHEVETRRQLLADVSHELRTPLTIIRGEAGVALRGGAKTAEEYREALVKAKEAAEHTASLVDDLLFVARQETGQTRLDLKDIDLSATLKNAVDRVRVVYSDDGFVIAFNSDLAEAPARIDERRLHQVMLILMENAHLYGAPPVFVSLSRIQSGYQIEVVDNGNGVADEEAAQIFERFFRGSNASTRYDGGTGLGLPVARSIVEAHGGSLVCDGRPGLGARFVINLPFKAPMRLVG